MTPHLARKVLHGNFVGEPRHSHKTSALAHCSSAAKSNILQVKQLLGIVRLRSASLSVPGSGHRASTNTNDAIQ